MRTLLDTEEEAERKPSEITLSTASLLGIFFGLVLVCGVFFGFGYSMGRGSGQARASMPVSPAAEPAETQTAEKTPPPVQPEPQAEEKAPVKASAPAADTADTEDVPPAPVARPTLKKPSAVQEAAVESQATLAAAPAVTPTAPSQPMVQIAAVARREDADVLVAALRQRGYGVVIRNEPQDKFFHVQVGPFADRVQATAIKQKLLSDGYNAIIKQ